MKIITTATLVHGLLLIIIGAIAYFIIEPRNSSYLYAPGIGLFLLMQLPALRKGNTTAFFIIVTLIFLMIIMTGSIFWSFAQPTDYELQTNSREELNRNAVLFGLMSASGVAVLLSYILAYFKRKKQQSEKEIDYREESSTPD
ncbi:MAG: hypothetical protein LPJ89_03730 [Hymenobacteraceae bacterium]|nr:hypothetical protein [Hymenobacteraceae bacterium]MDX5394714.1 hypothetical protein [Hymenobacteraceae bacterium]MDX5442874.1 hypothetical protein [Hymenobacteraceae bacterium]MDX5510747.1 hypothetical protein [Hymenobacteraceae bacterium]